MNFLEAFQILFGFFFVVLEAELQVIKHFPFSER